MRSSVVASGLAALGIVIVVAMGSGRRRGDDRVEELMERTHEGRRSPFDQVQRLLEADAPDWPEIERESALFEPMRLALAESPVADIRDSADGYIGAVKALGIAVGGRDVPATRTAFKALADSCGDCHFEGGVGGELEHGHGHGREKHEHEDHDEGESGESK